MTGLDPAIHVLTALIAAQEDVDARVKPGHDERETFPYPLLPCFSEAVAGLAPLAPATRT